MLLHGGRDRVAKVQTSSPKKRDSDQILGISFNSEGNETLECTR